MQMLLKFKSRFSDECFIVFAFVGWVLVLFQLYSSAEPCPVHVDVPVRSKTVETKPWDRHQSINVAVAYVQDPTVGRWSFIIQNVLSNIPINWRLQLFIPKGKVISDSLTLALAQTLPPRGSGRSSVVYLGSEYPRSKGTLFRSPEFWRMVDGENVLIFHSNTVVCSGRDHELSDFIDWDWIGAPWIWARTDTPYVYGGNGAISLRRKSVMLEITEAAKKNNEKLDANEDMWFVKRLVARGFKAAPKEVAMQFSVEEIFYPRPFAVSYAMRTLSQENRLKVLENCPEARVLSGYLPAADWIANPDQCSDVVAKKPSPPCPYP